MFSTFEIVKDLCENQGISLNTLEEKLGLGKNSLYGLKRNQPSAERLQQIADYFNVSTDYLLGRTENPNMLTCRIFVNVLSCSMVSHFLTMM